MNIKNYVYNNLGVKMNYRVYFPNDYKNLPLLVFLHGAGERGDNVDDVEIHGVPKLIKEKRELPAVVLCPQCPSDAVWDNVVFQLKEIIDSVAAEYDVLTDRISLTGLSMGGYGTWSLALTYPAMFSAIAPICGGGMAWRAPLLANTKTPVRAYHGSEDAVVIPEYSKIMIDKLKSIGADAELIMLDGLGHTDGANFAYLETDLVDWLLAQKRG